MNTNARLSQLRDALHGGPSHEAFTEVCGCFEGWSGADGLKVGLDYASKHLTSWPAHLREAPRAICQPLMEATELPPWWSLVRRATFDGLHLRQIRHLLRLKAFAKLDALGLFFHDDKAIEALVKTRQLSELRVLKLRANSVVGGRTFVSNRHLKKLEVLDLAGTPLYPTGRSRADGGLLLAGNKAFAGLKRLNLNRCRLSPEGAAAIVNAPTLQKLESLCLAEDRQQMINVTNRFVEALCASQLVHNLRELDLAGVTLSEDGLRALTQSGLRGLTHLDLSATGGAAHAMTQIVGAETLSGLRWLKVGGTEHWTENIQDSHLLPLCDESALPDLEVLELVDSLVTSEMLGLLGDRMRVRTSTYRGSNALWTRRPLSGEGDWLPDQQTWVWTTRR